MSVGAVALLDNEMLDVLTSLDKHESLSNFNPSGLITVSPCLTQLMLVIVWLTLGSHFRIVGLMLFSNGTGAGEYDTW